MRVETAFNKILAIPGAWVASVSFAPEGVVGPAPSSAPAELSLRVDGAGGL